MLYDLHLIVSGSRYGDGRIQHECHPNADATLVSSLIGQECQPNVVLLQSMRFAPRGSHHVIKHIERRKRRALLLTRASPKLWSSTRAFFLFFPHFILVHFVNSAVHEEAAARRNSFIFSVPSRLNPGMTVSDLPRCQKRRRCGRI